MEGYLKKWINFVYGWQPRYFILHEGLLIYCVKKGQNKKGSIALNIATMTLLPEDPLRIIINSGTQEIHIRAYSIDEKLKWVEAIKKAQEAAIAKNNEQNIDEYEKNMSPEAKNVFMESKIPMIQDKIAELWSTQAEIDETLSLLMPKVEKFHDIMPLIEKLLNLGDNLKKTLAICINDVDDERKKLIKIYKTIDVKSKTLSSRQQNYDDIDNQTEFQSFSDEDFFEEQKADSISNVTGDNIYKSKYIPDDDEDKFESNSFHKSKISYKESFLITLHPIKSRLLTTNPAFMGMEIPIDSIRKKLPHLINPHEKINVWSILKDSIGKDLTRFAVPVYLNEPLSMLQRLCEQNEYHELLNKANEINDSCLRMAYLMGFGMSPYSATIGRMKKPFNPILGETFEYVPIDKSFRYLSEQVSHHPPISAGFTESANFMWWADTNVKTSFWGSSLEFRPTGSRHVILKKFNDHFVFKTCTSGVHNLIFGQMYIDNYGDMTFHNYTTKDTAVLTLTKRGWNDKGRYEANGTIKDRNGRVRFIIKGKWSENLKAIDADTKQEYLIWTRSKVMEDWEQQFCFTPFTLQLNYLNQEKLIQSPPTDSRFRPDQKALENGNVQLAINEKLRLEEKQRTRRKQMATNNEIHIPKWFREATDELTGETYYKYLGGYWEAREKGNFTNLLDLYQKQILKKNGFFAW